MLFENRFALTYILKAHPDAVTLLLHANWMMLKNASNQDVANSVTVASDITSDMCIARWDTQNTDARLSIQQTKWRLGCGVK